MKYAVSTPQADLLREIAAVSDAVRIAPGRTQVARALEQRGLIKRTWRGSGYVAVVTADGRYYLKHGKHPRQVQAKKERLEGDSAQAALAPADGTELVSRLQSASGTITVADPAPQTRGRWRAAYYDALHHGHVPEGHKVRWNGRQHGGCVFTLVNEEAEKADAGVQVHVLRRIAGHGSLTTTQRYLHPDVHKITAAGTALSAHFNVLRTPRSLPSPIVMTR